MGTQIHGGKTAVDVLSDIVYSTPSGAGKKVELKPDIQVPKTAG